MKIAIPIKAKKMKECLSLMEIASREADILEIWVDEIKDFDLKLLLKNKKKPLICKSAKGNYYEGFDYIDIDVNCTNGYALNTKCKKIVSFHDYKKTPSFKKLQNITDKIIKTKADVVKIAVYIRRFSDNLIILKIAKYIKEKKLEGICIGMGKKGKLTRIITPMIFGDGIMFFALDKSKSTAEGQITINKISL